MSIKKTIGISVIFHLVLLSSALLFSAGLFRGSGNSIDENIFIVKLAVENSKAESMKLVSRKKPFTPVNTYVEKQKKKHMIVTKKRVQTVKVTVVPEPPPEIVETGIGENDEMIQHVIDTVQTGSHAVSDEALESSENQEETVQASFLTTDSKTGGLNSASVRSGLSPSMIDSIGSAIERAKSYPLLARRRGLEGTVHVSFRINESGEPDEIEIKKSSGHSILDSATVKVVKKAAPYPQTKNRVEVPVAYRLRK